MNTALILDVERFSAKDGPGIRTCIFFKGCNLRCKWCHNPESIYARKQIMFHASRCVSCGYCAELCKDGAQLMIGDLHTFLPEKCSECGSCVSECFSGAMETAGREMTVEELMSEIDQDALLYRKSGGGVTLTGGEVMLQADFALALLKKCREKGYGTCIETNLTLPWPKYEAVLPYLDKLYCDVKLFDCAEHRKWTGLDNIQILGNLEKLKSSGISFVVRTPVVTGVNDNTDCISHIAELLQNAENLEYYELLTYNPLGASKGILASSPQISRFEIPTHEHMTNLSEAAAAYVRTKLDGKVVIDK